MTHSILRSIGLGIMGGALLLYPTFTAAGGEPRSAPGSALEPAEQYGTHQGAQQPGGSTESRMQRSGDNPVSASRAGAARLTATLVSPEEKAREHTATVEAKITGVKLIDPAKVHEHAKRGQGHLHYRVDEGPVIATTATKLSFHELSPGQHTIHVMLAANDHTPLGPQQTLSVTISGGAAGDQPNRTSPSNPRKIGPGTSGPGGTSPQGAPPRPAPDDLNPY